MEHCYSYHATSPRDSMVHKEYYGGDQPSLNARSHVPDHSLLEYSNQSISNLHSLTLILFSLEITDPLQLYYILTASYLDPY